MEFQGTEKLREMPWNTLIYSVSAKAAFHPSLRARQGVAVQRFHKTKPWIATSLVATRNDTILLNQRLL